MSSSLSTDQFLSRQVSAPIIIPDDHSVGGGSIGNRSCKSTSYRNTGGKCPNAATRDEKPANNSIASSSSSESSQSVLAPLLPSPSSSPRNIFRSNIKIPNAAPPHDDHCNHHGNIIHQQHVREVAAEEGEEGTFYIGLVRSLSSKVSLAACPSSRSSAVVHPLPLLRSHTDTTLTTNGVACSSTTSSEKNNSIKSFFSSFQRSNTHITQTSTKSLKRRKSRLLRNSLKRLDSSQRLALTCNGSDLSQLYLSGPEVDTMDLLSGAMSAPGCRSESYCASRRRSGWNQTQPQQHQRQPPKAPRRDSLGSVKSIESCDSTWDNSTIGSWASSPSQPSLSWLEAADIYARKRSFSRRKSSYLRFLELDLMKEIRESEHGGADNEYGYGMENGNVKGKEKDIVWIEETAYKEHCEHRTETPSAVATTRTARPLSSSSLYSSPYASMMSTCQNFLTKCRSPLILVPAMMLLDLVLGVSLSLYDSNLLRNVPGFRFPLCYAWTQKFTNAVASLLLICLSRRQEMEMRVRMKREREREVEKEVEIEKIGHYNYENNRNNPGNRNGKQHNIHTQHDKQTNSSSNQEFSSSLSSPSITTSTPPTMKSYHESMFIEQNAPNEQEPLTELPSFQTFRQHVVPLTAIALVQTISSALANQSLRLLPLPLFKVVLMCGPIVVALLTSIIEGQIYTKGRLVALCLIGMGACRAVYSEAGVADNPRSVMVGAGYALGACSFSGIGLVLSSALMHGGQSDDDDDNEEDECDENAMPIGVEMSGMSGRGEGSREMDKLLTTEQNVFPQESSKIYDNTRNGKCNNNIGDGVAIEKQREQSNRIDEELHPLSLLFYLSCEQVLMLSVYLCPWDELGTPMEEVFNGEEEPGEFLSFIMYFAQNPRNTSLYLMTGSMMALCLAVLTFVLVNRTSPVAASLLGNVRSIATVAISSMVFEGVVKRDGGGSGGNGMFGYTMTLAGGILYALAALQTDGSSSK